MDRSQLRYFAAIHQEGSLARAAERERVAVSALSRRFGILEDRARLRMNTAQAIAGALLEGTGCAVGTSLFVHEQRQTFALETVHEPCIRLSLEAIADGRWQAPPRSGNTPVRSG